MPNPRLLGFSKIATGTPAGFCREVTGGDFTLDPHDIVTPGIGNRIHNRKGVEEATAKAQCYGVVYADLVKWFPVDGALTVSSVPDFLVDLDGTTQYTLTSCQPGAATISNAGGNAHTINDLEIKGIADVMTGETAVYLSTKGHTLKDITITIGGADYNVLSWSLTNGLVTEMEIYGDGPTADHEWEPDAFIISDITGPVFTCTTRLKLLPDQNVRNWTAGLAIVITLANGTPAENLTFTLSDFSATGPYNVPFETGAVSGFQNTFTILDGVRHGRAVLTGGA